MEAVSQLIFFPENSSWYQLDKINQTNKQNRALYLQVIFLLCMALHLKFSFL